MDTQKIISFIASDVEARLSGEGSGHDWWHIYRVWKMSQRIGGEEQADMQIVEMAALLHDIADWKFHDGDEDIGPRIAGEIMGEHGVSSDVIEHVQLIIRESGFKGAPVEPSTLEGKVMQDADRLDAIGAIGIARCFAYGGHKGRVLYDPAIEPVVMTSKEQYAKNTSPSINHFYEKLLLLKDLMNTDTGRKLAKERHQFIEAYLEQFYGEWEGKL